MLFFVGFMTGALMGTACLYYTLLRRPPAPPPRRRTFLEYEPA